MPALLPASYTRRAHDETSSARAANAYPTACPLYDTNGMPCTAACRKHETAPASAMHAPSVASFLWKASGMDATQMTAMVMHTVLKIRAIIFRTLRFVQRVGGSLLLTA